LQSTVPKELDRILLKPLAKDPGLRPARARHIVRQLRAAYYQAQIREWKAKELPKRAGLSVFSAFVFMLFFLLVAQLPPLQILENKLVDARFYFTPVHSPHADIVLVSIDDDTLAADPTPLVERADEMGRMLQRIFDAGAVGAAVDFLLPEKWGRAP